MAERHQKRSLVEIFTVVGSVATILCFLAALVVVPEFRRALKLDKEVSGTSETKEPEATNSTLNPEMSGMRFNSPSATPAPLKSSTSPQAPQARLGASAPTVETSPKETSEDDGLYGRQVKKLIAARLKVAPEKVTDNARLVKDLHADELDMAELNLALQDSFELNHITELDSVDFITVKDVVRYVNSHAPKKAAEPVATRPASLARVDCHDKQNWRRLLHAGMTRDEVRQLFGEPDHIMVSGRAELWRYGNGSIDFLRESLFSWSEP